MLTSTASVKSTRIELHKREAHILAAEADKETSFMAVVT